MSKNRARLMILNDLMSFPNIKDKDWNSDISGGKAKVGDLVSLSCARPSKWYLSWLHEINPNNGCPKYLLESIEDGELCWWENVGLTFYNRERVENRQEWKWDDKQFEFADRWHKVCRNNDAYMMKPCQPVFNDSGSVLLNVRIRHQFSDYTNPVTFPQWKKVTMKQMDAYYKKSFDEYEKYELSNKKSA